jgi:hypothetical protein
METSINDIDGSFFNYFSERASMTESERIIEKRGDAQNQPPVT